ncbi:hypothetical protein RFI_36578 [Reticulomyxa filosa]|uniref:Uncharacterized protein n=1 Tax=Reticulomyxa filosa TaxID=46433 RepID=X6LIB7_RETFI|nr:hypothetical protein RFI_36578 [Reticulomyxa filosa]|eukprot:ETO00862.1 hypothetical protein RFI_36578 [Reticulomyxa filosa]
MISITNLQCQELMQKFVTTAKNLKVSLESAIHTALGKRVKTTSILVTMLTPTADYIAQMLRDGLKQLPLLIEVICTCTNQHDMLQEVHKATKSKKNLNSMLSTILKANRLESSQVNVAEAIQDATLLKPQSPIPTCGNAETIFQMALNRFEYFALTFFLFNKKKGGGD